MSDPSKTSAGHSRGPGQFHTTHWSVVLAAGESSSPQSAAALEILCRAYWYPLYAYVRRSGRAVAEAEDLTQDFFEHLLEKGFPSGIKPQGGKLRSYLLAALKNFIINEWISRQTVKRGGGKSVLSWEDLQAETRYRSEPVNQTGPEQLFEQRWASALLDHVRAGLEQEFTAEGKERLFQRLRFCLTEAPQAISYEALATQLGMSAGAVRTAVYRLRKRYGELLRFEIGRTVARPEDVEDEIRCLIAATGA